MASHNPEPGPVPTKSDDEGKWSWSQSLQEAPEDPRHTPSFSPINHTYPQADPILIQNRSPGIRESRYYGNSHLEYQKPHPIHRTVHPIHGTVGTSSLAFKSTTSLSIPSPIPEGGSVVGPSSPGMQENHGSEEANSSLSSGGPPAGNLALSTWRMATKRVFLRLDEEKAQLVHLCIANFGDFVMGKERFWSKISTLYQQLHPEGVAPNVKGYMQQFTVQPRKEVEETLSKSGIAESAMEWQQSMDHWLELVRDCEDQLKEGKNTATKEEAHQKKELVTLRENITKSLMRKRGLPERASSPILVEDSGESKPATVLGDSDSQFSDGFPNKNHRPHATCSKPAGDRVFASQRRTTNRILNTLRGGDQEKVNQIREMEHEKIDRWKEILGGASRGDNQVLGERIEQLEKQGKETQETLAKIVTILQNLEGHPY